MPSTNSISSHQPGKQTRKSMFLASLFFSLLIPGIAIADVYRCQNPDGAITITNSNQPGSNCTKVATEAPVQSSGSATKAKVTTTPKDFPRVDNKAQENKDKDRKRILEQELQAEEKALGKAKQELADQEKVRLGDERNYQKVLDRLQPYKDQVSLHEQNIEALKKEINR